MTTLQQLLGSPESVGVWTLVPEQSTIGFKAKSFWGLAPVKGKYTDFSGDGQITDPTAVSGRIDVKAASVDTKNKTRDAHMRSADYFDVEKYPDISVAVTGAEAISGDTVNLRADLTVKGITKPVPLRAKVAVLDDGTVQLTTKADINRKDFGVDGNMMGMIPDGATVTADMVFRRAGA